MDPPVLLDRPAQMRLLRRARGERQPERGRSLARLLADFRPAALAAIHKVLRSLGLGAEHAEEALQRAALRFIEVGVDSFRGEAAPRTYFVRIAVACALDIGREAARRQRLEKQRAAPPWLAGPAGGVRADELLSAREVRRRLAGCLGKLAGPYRQSVRRYYLQEAGDCAACALELGISKAAFEKRLSRARVMLARCLEEGEHG